MSALPVSSLILLSSTAFAALAPLASAQANAGLHRAELTRICVGESAPLSGLDLALDAGGGVHFSGVDPESGDLVHVFIAPDGQQISEVIAAGFAPSEAGADALTVSTSLALGGPGGAEPALCAFDPAARALLLFQRAGGAYTVRTVAAGSDVGADCALLAPDASAALRVAYRLGDHLVVAADTGTGFDTAPAEPMADSLTEVAPLGALSVREAALLGIADRATPNLLEAVDPFGAPVRLVTDVADGTTCLYRLPDADGDAVPDEFESNLGTDPHRADSDGDGASDGEEVLLLATNPAIPDGCTPAPEDCNALDDDCDGEVDEDLSRGCYSGPEGTEGIGTCLAGTQLCGAGLWAGCEGAIVPIVGDQSCDGADEDCDGVADEGFVRAFTRCGLGRCAASGVTACIGGALQDSCAPGQPGPDDAACDGADDDCDGETDEDFEPLPVSCGDGACRAAGVVICQAGELVDTCERAEPAPDDASCDGIDDDCDATVDEDYTEGATSCGVGVCASNGRIACADGLTIDTCEVRPGGNTDGTCDGLDSDCNGQVDEDFRPYASRCGVGACQRNGRVSCVRGGLSDDCRAGAPVGDDATCDGRDDDCDGRADEAARPSEATCGLGACLNRGLSRCVAGRNVLDCVPGPRVSADDAACDGVDEDCDGRTDEGYSAAEETCGVGVCARTSVRSCVDGSERGACVAGEGEGSDDDCDGLDDDCDGAADESFGEHPATCGLGACLRPGTARCEDGAVAESCTPGEPAGADETCDGSDDDCDGQTDEDFVAGESQCGAGACAAVGGVTCAGGQRIDTCVAGAPGVDENDETCDGLDDDCDGAVDEGFVGGVVDCGPGACAPEGRESCADGLIVGACGPIPIALPDAGCDGLDDDCDGAVDEDFEGEATTCGEGACAADGETRCEDGRIVDTCAPAEGDGDDSNCDDRDDDCDGDVDEGFGATEGPCGEGACAGLGVTFCDRGQVVTECAPAAGLAGVLDDDSTCDDRDDDCDGRIDEDYSDGPVTCGEGACAVTGEWVCRQGWAFAECGSIPRPTSASDDTCDGVDEDCDGEVDEDFDAVEVTCGAGACAAVGVEFCDGGEVVTECAPARGISQRDATCDGLDDDCDGAPDDEFVGAALTCGLGACRAAGREQCVDGQLVSACEPGAAAAADETCDGQDDDCDGATDEDFQGEATTCGQGACAGQGVMRCEGGEVRSSCIPEYPAASDNTCDGLDDDCDGAADEDFDSVPVRCGAGACAAQGERTCENGERVERCEAGPTQGADDDCDGRDQDCDGEVDEGYAARPILCGEGACGGMGLSACQGGREYEICERGAPAQGDSTCNGIDEDCDGAVDEDAVSQMTRCGMGACVRAGTTLCVDGQWLEMCETGAPGAGDDARCDGLDEDCDGLVDEDCRGDEPGEPVEPDEPEEPAEPDSGELPAARDAGTEPAPDAPDGGEAPHPLADAGDQPVAPRPDAGTATEDAASKRPEGENGGAEAIDEPESPEPGDDAGAGFLGEPDAFGETLFDFPDVSVPAEVLPPVVSCDCKTSGGAGARPLGVLFGLLLGVVQVGLRRGRRRLEKRAD